MTPFRRCTLATLVLLSLAACGDKTEPTEQQSERPQQEADGKRTSVNVVAAERRQLQAWVYSQGTARSRQREFLTFTQQGVVSHVDETLRVGMPVKAGQLIAHQAPERVTADLQAAKASLAEAQASLALAEVTQKRYEKLIEQRSASRQELDEARVQVQQAKAVRDNARAELAQAQLSVDESRLVSPIDGVLARLNIEKGRYFMPNTIQTDTEQNALRTVPAMVIDPQRFEVRVDLPSYNYRQIQTGAKTVIGENASVAGQDIDPMAAKGRVEGQVHAISPSLDPETRTFEVIVHTQGTETGLQDGEFVAVWIAEPSADEALVVPLEALRFRNDQAFVFVADQNSGKVSERRVELGQQSGEHRAVTAGLEEGELVVTDGRAALNDGQQVRIIGTGGNAS
ncbi:MAG: efflux RND transporter periplasmic adaptor subunit [Pseudomonas sp.]|uniref:efflux RND transporter periplasmic adaptor subunit n=1 Tax=Pseudomonas sp. TaxID=306 RepID=UPI003D0F1F98